MCSIVLLDWRLQVLGHRSSPMSSKLVSSSSERESKNFGKFLSDDDPSKQSAMIRCNPKKLPNPFSADTTAATTKDG